MRDPNKFEVGDYIVDLESGREARIMDEYEPGQFSFEYLDSDKPRYGQGDAATMQRVSAEIKPLRAPASQEIIMPIEVPTEEPIVVAAPAEDNAIARSMRNPETQRVFREYQESLKKQAIKREKEDAERIARDAAAVDATSAAAAATEPSPAVDDVTSDDTEVVAPLYAIGDPVEHRDYGLAKVTGNSASGVHVHYDVAPEETGDEDDIVCAEELRSASPYTKVEAAEVIRNHFSVIFEPGDWGCVTFIDPEKKAPVVNSCCNVAQFVKDKAIARLFEQNETLNCYATLNSVLSTSKNRRKKEELAACRCIFFEVDENGDAILAKVRASVAVGEIPAPTFVLQSSPHKYQMIWIVNSRSEKHPDGFTLKVVELYNRAFVKKFDGDDACTDVLRVFRLPGLRNLKYPQRPVVEVIETNKSRRYNPEDFHIPLEEEKTIVDVDAKTPATKAELADAVYCMERNMDEGNVNRSPMKKWEGEGNEHLWEITCPWVLTHTDQKDSGTMVGIHTSGAPDFVCLHGHCVARPWEDFRNYLKGVVGHPQAFRTYPGVTLGGKTSEESCAEVEARKAADAAKAKEIEAKQPTSDPVEALKRIEKQKALEELEKHRVTPETQEKAKEDRSREIEARIDKRATTPRPVFPYWVMEGTSLYEGLVKPAIEHSSKHAEFIFMAGVQIVLNYLDRKVFISCSTVNYNMYLGFISPPGKFFKSSSSGLAHKYYRTAGLLESFKPSGKNENSKETIFLFQTGSTEGMGKSLYKMGGSHAILFNDELGRIVSKAGIESSTLSYDLLTLYESDEWGNTVSTEANCFAFPAKTYTIGWNWCTTDRGFNTQWAKVAGLVAGLEDRMFFLISPNKMKPTKAYKDPEMATSSLKSKDLIAAAVRRHIFSYDNLPVLDQALDGLSARSINLVQALALYFAVDLGRISIDDECIKRAAAIVQCRIDGIAFLQPIEASTPQGRRQKEIERELRQHGGMMKKRDLQRNLDYTSDGSEFWNRAYDGLMKDKRIVEWDKRMPSGQWGRMVGLLRHVEDVDGVVDSDEDQAA